ncbi:hypothetical protein MMC07_000063 [Pseudocyphellaria aurata]|nr:hypothetical protein [Pseudocyphellaria aurata]
MESAAREEAGISGPNLMLQNFFLEKAPAFYRLEELKKIGWKQPQGDAYYSLLRKQANNQDSHWEQSVFVANRQTGEELDSQTSALSLPGWPQNEVKILDLCMAPGGFSAAAREKNPNAVIRGISLPDNSGGLKMHFEDYPEPVKCEFLDITTLATEFGVSTIPETHPDPSSFTTNRPYLGDLFHLVICGGQLVSDPDRSRHRERLENVRLSTSQLILALQRIVTGGTLVMLLRKAEAWDTAQFLYQFSQFSAIQLYKPSRQQNHRNSFYLIAKGVQPDHEAAKAAISGWKEAWGQATFGGLEGVGDVVGDEDNAIVQKLIDEFGERLIELAIPIWKIQSDALVQKVIAPY